MTLQEFAKLSPLEQSKMAEDFALSQLVDVSKYGAIQQVPEDYVPSQESYVINPPASTTEGWDRPDYGAGELTSTAERLHQVTGMEERDDRGMLLPYKGDDGWVAPEILYSMGKGAMLPLQASIPGSQISMDDTIAATLDYAGMGLGANTFGKFIPENSLGILGSNLKAIPQAKSSGRLSGTPQTMGRGEELTPYTKKIQMSKRQDIFEGMAKEGIGAKDWYKNVDEFMRKFFPSGRMNRELAAGILSPTSSSNPVKQNVKDMLRAYAQIKGGVEPQAGMYPSQTQAFFREYKELIKTGQSPLSVKEQIFDMALKWKNFDKNNAGDLWAVTNDRYIRRLAGFFRGSTTGPQYKYMTALIKDTAERMGIKPAEAQAAAWTAFKARWDAVQPGIQRWAVKKGWWDEAANDVYSGKIDPVTGIKGPDFREKFHNKIFNAAIKHKPSEQELAGAGQSFPDFAQVGGMGVEFSPGLKFWPELGGAPKQVQDAYHDGMQKIFFRTSKDGRISHAQLDDMGIPHSVTPRTTGFYEGETSPGYYVQLLLPEDSKGTIHQSILNRLHAGIATIGRTSGQDAIGYYKMVDAPVGQADMYHMNIGRTLTDSETIKLEAGLKGLGLNHTVIPINRLDGVDIYYTDFKGGNGILDKDRFVLEVEQYLSRGEWADTDTAMISEGIGKYKGEYFSYENLGPTGKEYKDGSREIHWQNLANKSGAGEESARVHAVYSQQVKRFQSKFAETNGLPDPNFRHLEKPQSPLSIEESLRGRFGTFPSRQQPQNPYSIAGNLDRQPLGAVKRRGQ